MPPDRPRRRTGRVQQHRVEPLPRLPDQRIRHHQLRLKTAARKVLPHPPHPRLRQIDRHHLCPACGNLQRLAPRRAAQVQHPLPRHRRQQPHGQRGGGILHPPPPGLISRQGRNLPLLLQPQRPRRQQVPLRHDRPRAQRQVQRRHACLHRLHRRHGLAPIGMHKGLAQPARHPLRGQPFKGLIRHFAQHGIHQPGHMPRPLAAPHDLHRRVHRAMRRAAHRDLNHRKAQRIPHHPRRCLAQMGLQHPVRLLQMPQHRQGQPLRPRTIRRRQSGQRPLRIGHDLRHQPPLAQHRAQQSHCRRPCRQSFCRHAATLVPLFQGRISTARHKEPIP